MTPEQPLAPYEQDPEGEIRQRRTVARDPVVGEMTAPLLTQQVLLLREGAVSIVPQYMAHNRRAEVVQIVELDLGGHFGLTQVDGRDGFGRDTICGCCFCWRI